MFYLYDNVKRMVASYSYDDIGRLVSLKRSGNVGMVNYAYNIRNWLNETKSDFIFEDGKLDKYLFDGGYCSFGNNQNPTFHYYEKDHLGSVRMVVNENGTIEQVNHYYPFGGVYGDLSYNAELQSLNFAKKAVNKNILRWKIRNTKKLISINKL